MPVPAYSTGSNEIDQPATAAPGPLSRRLRRNADRLRETADVHDATAHNAEALA
ncbi:hypothetical protein [Streptomyces sp. NPDC005989]|uniref:hypothetical protein n=1 Tax=Streptomyces sp. NPDC005989 TaxID=3156727 RepID=UPI0033F520BA